MMIEMFEDESGVWENSHRAQPYPAIRIEHDAPKNSKTVIERGDFVTVLGHTVGRTLQQPIIAKPYRSPFYSYMFNVDIQLTGFFPSDAVSVENVERVKWVLLDHPEKTGESSVSDLIHWMNVNDVRVYTRVDDEFIDMQPHPTTNPTTLKASQNDENLTKLMKLDPYSF